MAQRRFHYEKAFEHFLRANGVPYVAVDEAKRALQATGSSSGGSNSGGAKLPLKSFDFVVYGGEGAANLLVDVKGRKHAGNTGKALQNWVTREDVSSLERWSGIFGEGFEPVFAFLFWCDAAPPDALFLEVFEFGEKWYAVQAIRLSAYVPAMRDRSKRWDTVSVPAAHFMRHARPIKELLGLK